jgi:hypothetical protein
MGNHLIRQVVDPLARVAEHTGTRLGELMAGT